MMSTNDERPRPKYGEYATPQQQAEIIAHSLPPVSPLLKPGGLTPPPPPEPASAPPRKAPERRRWDLILSIALLAYGLWVVLSGLAQYSDFPTVVQGIYDLLGIGKFTSADLANTVGSTINIVNVALYATVLAITVWLLRTKRLAFWVPLAGGLLAMIVTGVLVGVLLFNDPAYLEFVTSSR